MTIFRFPFASRRSLVAAGTVFLLVIGGSTASALSASAVPSAGATPGWPSNPDWQKYVQTPKSADVQPVSIVGTTGNVTNASALTGTGTDKGTTLTATPRTVAAHPVTVSFAAVQTRYVRVNVTKLGQPETGNTNGSYLQLAELQAFGSDTTNNLAAGKTVTTSETLQVGGWNAKYLTDGVNNTENPSATGWTSQQHSNLDVSASPIWATIDLGSVQTVSSVVLWPRTDTLTSGGQTANFPVDFSIQASADNSTFVPQKTITNQTVPAPPTVSGSASITLDYGKDIGGIPFFEVSAASGSPTLQAGYSEGKQWATAAGDQAGDNLIRHDSYTVTAPGTLSKAVVQGGERYQVISLTSPGSVTLSSVGITYIADRTAADDYAGHFVSSSDQLNQIWYDSAYTAQLDSVPANSLPGAWTVSDGMVKVIQGGVVLLNQGSTWSNYTMSFDAQVVANQAGWIVHGQDANNGYLFILNAEGDTEGTPGILQEYEMNNGSYVSLGSAPLPAKIQPNTWHAISTTVNASALTVSIDGVAVGNVDLTKLPGGAKAFPTGTVGFRESNNEAANYKNLKVTDTTGATLYGTSFSSSAALADFTDTGSNSLPSVLDGAKRDRSIWTGDLNIEGPTLYYSAGGTANMKGALEIVGGQQLQSGFVTGAVDPKTPANTGALLPGTTGFYSAAYSMYWVLAMGAYNLHTGDTAFVTKEYPRVKAELAWNATLLDSNGLLVTNADTGRDWDAYDPAKTGEVTEYNLIYYKALLDGAQMATTAADSAQASAYLQQAATLKTAINAKLLDATTGLYKITDTVPGVPQDANSLAVLYGVAPASKSAAILAGLETQLAGSAYGPLPFSADAGLSHNISPFISGYQLEAQLASDDTTRAQKLLSTVWGNMIAPGDNNTSTMWEVVNPVDGTPGFDSYTSLAHGWSAAPTAALSAYVLGIQPVTPGYATWLVQPHPGDLAWTMGQAPTPHGPVVVDWSHDTSTGFAMHVEAPSATSGTIAVPTFGKQIDLFVNGTKVWSHGTSVPGAGVSSATLDGDFVDLAVTSGTFDISTGPVQLTDQTITFAALANANLTDGATTVSATATSGLPVVFTAAGDCTVTGSTVHFSQAGTCTITASQAGDSQYAAAASVSRSFTIAAPVAAPPTPITPAKVTVTGSAKVGATLTAHLGAWGTPRVTLAYQWLRDGKAISKAVKPTYKLVKADNGHRDSVRVTASAPGLTSVSVTSETLAVHLALTSTPRPKLHGIAKVGHKLTVTAGKWKPSSVHLTYHWYRNGKLLKHATGKSYKLVTADRRAKITISVTGSKKGYLSETESRTSAKVK